MGPPVLTSNNPEVVTGPGLLYGNARPMPTRGGAAAELSGDFGIYLHHLVDTADGRPLFVSILITNPNAGLDVTVDVEGSGFTQTETGGLGLGTSPDYRVSEDALLGTFAESHAGVSIEPFRPFLAWQRQVNDRSEVDGRFFVQSDLPVFAYVVATESADINDAVTAVLEEAPGDYRVSDPLGSPPRFGREAGVYAHDTWQGTITLDVPAVPSHVAFMVNTATGGGLSQVQAFPALAHLDQSAAEAVGMYGNFYDLTIELRHDGLDELPRTARVTFSSLVTAAISRYWDGVGLVDGVAIDIRHTPVTAQAPGNATTLLKQVTLSPGERRTIHFRTIVPGLASIPQALVVESGL